MWYFSWVLGLGLACTFAILNAMWLEVREEAPVANDPRAIRPAGKREQR
ncbi:MAG TPA: cytochrome bd-I oxidase subunit CydX [Stellaceae bacterium]|nr:cytochrome bd-I oxidase subunit CydX [Stellaceae bacterium]